MLRCLALVLSLLAPSSPAAAASFVALDLPGSQLTALSDDGHSAAGSVVGSAGGGFRWRKDLGARLLPEAVSMHAISPSGRYVAGSSLDRNAGEVATWWDADDVPHPVDVVPSVGRAISDAGELRGDAGADGGRRLAFRWSAAGGLRWLGDAVAQDRLAECADGEPPGDAQAQRAEYAAASRDGALRVGHTGSGGERRAIVWTAQGGVQPLATFLAAHGVEVPQDWILLAATAVDPDARHIGGYGLHHRRFDSFIAELPSHVRLLCRPPALSGHPPSQEITP